MKPPGTAIIDADQMRSRLAEIAKTSHPALPPGEHIVSEERWRLRERVVLLDYFTAASLAATGAYGAATVHAFLARDCEFVTTRSGGGWRLTTRARASTLARLGPRAALRVQDAVPAGEDDVTHCM